MNANHADGMTVVDHLKKMTGGAMLIVGFPTHGLVGSIAAGYLVQSLNMVPMGYVTGDVLPPTVVMDEGSAASPFRLYASGVVCGPDRKCSQLLVALSDIQPETGLMNRFGRTLLDWAESKGVSLVVVIEGKPVEGRNVSQEVRVVAAANPAGKTVMESCGFEGASGQMTGMGGAFLRESLERSLPVVCLIPEVSKEQPDSGAAAKVVELVQPLVPSLPIDAEPLRVAAQALERSQKVKITDHKSSLQSLSTKGTEGLYR